MADKKAPERIWWNEEGHWSSYDDSDYRQNPSVPFVPSDLYDAAVKQRDELAAEVERLTKLVSASEKQRYRVCGELLTRAEKAEAEVERLRSALHVFASAADGRRRKDWLGGVCFQQDVLLAAREALQRKEENE